VGRPGLAGLWAQRVREILSSTPDLSTAEILRRLRLQGCPGGKTALYHLVALCRLRGPELKQSGNCWRPALVAG
jgi:hypothetical protein